MKKEEFIKRKGEAAYAEKLAKRRALTRTHRAEAAARTRAWAEANPEKVEERNHEISRKGGRHYERHLKYKRTGIPGEKSIIRSMHGDKWRSYKQIIAPDSQIHHEWKPESAEYDGVALVERVQHQHGIVDVIRILKGEITLFTEEEIRNQVC